MSFEWTDENGNRDADGYHEYVSFDGSIYLVVEDEDGGAFDVRLLPCNGAPSAPSELVAAVSAEFEQIFYEKLALISQSSPVVVLTDSNLPQQPSM